MRNCALLSWKYYKVGMLLSIAASLWAGVGRAYMIPTVRRPSGCFPLLSPLELARRTAEAVHHNHNGSELCRPYTAMPVNAHPMHAEVSFTNVVISSLPECAVHRFR